VVRGTNEDELADLIEFGKRAGAEVRFIEYMDVGGATQWSRSKVVSRAEILDALRPALRPDRAGGGVIVPHLRSGSFWPTGPSSASSPPQLNRSADAATVVRLTADGDLVPVSLCSERNGSGGNLSAAAPPGKRSSPSS